ncbi:hypothetical protein STEG23_007701, partial [Scotinomys teguina]
LMDDVMGEGKEPPVGENDKEMAFSEHSKADAHMNSSSCDCVHRAGNIPARRVE